MAPSYEHDEYGATTESPEMKVLMTEKRARKLENFFEKEKCRGYEVYTSPLDKGGDDLREAGDFVANSPKKMLVTTSFITYTALDFIKDNPDYGLIVIKMLKPLDERLRDELI
jgi:2-oxoglutarate ferredoxin oxidoreductase subunit alpha